MRNIILIAFLSLVTISGKAQVSSYFTVYGDINTYYAVSFTDGGWDDNIATELALGRSNVHTDANWRGSLIAKVSYHVTNWGHAANFISVDMSESTGDPAVIKNFIGGWMDGTIQNGSYQMVMWLRGGGSGGTRYYYHSNYPVNPVVHDGSQNPVTYTLDNVSNTVITSKTAVDAYVRINGITLQKDIQTSGAIAATGTGNNYLAGPLSIGVNGNYGYQLAVNGNAIFNKVVVKQYPNWPDYVFDSAYRMLPLADLHRYVRSNHHLPDMPSADSVAAAGLDLGVNQAALLRKIEELTLYIIAQDAELQRARQDRDDTNAELKSLRERLDGLERLLGKPRE